MKRFKILQLDGGGLLGIMFLTFLVELENKINKKISNIFDMFIGTSTGGIAGALFAKGMSSKEVLDFYLKHGKKIFDRKYFWILRGSKYNRKYIDKLVDKLLPMRMAELDKIFICTGVNMKDNQYTHFFKSYKDKYQNKKVSEMIKRTYSAPTYFGYYKDQEGMWSDGGVGVHNCTLLEAYIDSKRIKKYNYQILSCGCGIPGLNSNSDGLISQIKDFIPIARRQAIQMQINNGKEIGINFYRVDIKIKSKYDCLDGVKYMKIFQDYGKDMIKEHLNNTVKFLK
jgi:hypothetical protein